MTAAWPDISDRHTLLTRKVTETPLHKQVPNRLLQRQLAGRSVSSIGFHEQLSVEAAQAMPL